jgi:hypothetical protein
MACTPVDWDTAIVKSGELVKNADSSSGIAYSYLSCTQRDLFAAPDATLGP